VPLLVYLKEDPHRVSTRGNGRGLQTLIEAGVAVLAVNHRGSAAQGDRSLEAIMGSPTKVTSLHLDESEWSFSQVSAEDVRFAVETVLSVRPELDPQRVTLLGHGFGGNIGELFWFNSLQIDIFRSRVFGVSPRENVPSRGLDQPRR